MKQPDSKRFGNPAVCSTANDCSMYLWSLWENLTEHEPRLPCHRCSFFHEHRRVSYQHCIYYDRTSCRPRGACALLHVQPEFAPRTSLPLCLSLALSLATSLPLCLSLSFSWVANRRTGWWGVASVFHFTGASKSYRAKKKKKKIK